MYRKSLASILLALALFSCGNNNNNEKTATSEQKSITLPSFSADSAYKYVEDQLNFGARVPGSTAHKQCLEYYINKFEDFGATTEIQEGYGIMYDGKRENLYNVIAKINPNASQRILICAHWDCRPWADEETDEELQKTPVMGANDGASGVAVIMELCRIMSKNSPNVGVDFVLFDLEDSGTPTFFKGKVAHNDTWCLGSQYWAKTLKNSNTKPIYGILLDMVGAPGAQFYKEGISMHFAPHIVEKVWSNAYDLGFSQYFKQHEGGMVTDDHLYVNTIANIPCINIIQYNPLSEHGFGEYWHTINDDISNIDKNTLAVVGNTLIKTIYEE